MNDCKYINNNMIHYIFKELDKNEIKIFENHLSSCPNCLKEKKNLENDLNSMSNLEKLSPSFNSYVQIKKRIFGKDDIKKKFPDKILTFFKRHVPMYGVFALITLFIVLKSFDFSGKETKVDYLFFMSDSIQSDTLKFSSFEDIFFNSKKADSIVFEQKYDNLNIDVFKPEINYVKAESEMQRIIIKMMIEKYIEYIYKRGRITKNKDVTSKFEKSIDTVDST